jgi:26S proteasome regulatory subunit N10
MSMGGSGPEVLTTLTTNPGKILDGLHRTKIGGQSHLYTGIMIASVSNAVASYLDNVANIKLSKLALKHRQNKSQRQRIIVFTCSPLSDSSSTLTKLAKKMKKNNTSIDIVAFGDLTDDNLEKLRAFNEAVKGGEGSHLEVVPPGPNLLSDSIVASPILAGEGGGAAANGGGAGGAEGGDDFEFGIDPSVDPELALALRMSLEEDKARQERERKTQEDAEGKTALDSVPEASESQPLLDGDAGSSSDHKKDKDQDDKMNTD